MKSVFWNMRHVLLLAAATLLPSIAPHSANAVLVGHWKLDENPAADATTIVDSSSLGNNGSLTTGDGATNKSVASSVPALGTAIDFDGTGDLIGPIAIGAAMPAGTDPRTASFWFRADNIPSSERWIFQQGDASGQGKYFRFSFEDDGSGKLGIVQRHGGGARFYDPAIAIAANQWIHVAAVVPDGALTTAQVLVYINGVASPSSQVGTTSPRNLAVPAESPIFLGGNVTDGAAFSFDGSIDDVQVYNTALTAADISFLFSNPGQTISTVLAGDYNGNNVVDAADYTVWRDNLGAVAGTLSNDVDGGVIGPAQYATWKANFGNVPGSGSALGSAAVPEPASLVLFGVAFLGLSFASRRCHR